MYAGCEAMSRGGIITSKPQVMLANQKPEQKQKRHSTTTTTTTTTMVQCKVLLSVQTLMCGPTMLRWRHATPLLLISVEEKIQCVCLLFNVCDAFPFSLLTDLWRSWCPIGGFTFQLSHDWQTWFKLCCIEGELLCGPQRRWLLAARRHRHLLSLLPATTSRLLLLSFCQIFCEVSTGCHFCFTSAFFLLLFALAREPSLLCLVYSFCFRGQFS